MKRTHTFRDYRLQSSEQMGENAGYLEIIKQAQLGNRDSMSRLAKEVRERVFVYTYRVTLDYHLAQDLSQDTVLEMFKSLERLKIESADLLWSWLYRTALGKIQHHFRSQGSRKIEEKTIFNGEELLKHIPKDNRNELNSLLENELSQVVLEAMSQMKATYRNVLTLRCFEQMSYAEIAAITGGTEMQARLLFFRAKQLLKRQLAQNGFKKEHLLPAIGLFGAITVSSTKPASAAVAVSSTAAGVGITTAIIGTATSTTGIVTTITAIIIMSAAIGTVKIFEASTTADKILHDIKKTGEFEEPVSLLRACAPDGRLEGFHRLPDPNLIVPPTLWLWAEYGFSGEIVDGPGIDIYLDERITGERSLVFITDGAKQAVQITPTAVSRKSENGYQWNGVDISGLTLPFKPHALRFVGGPRNMTETRAIWARVSRQPATKTP